MLSKLWHCASLQRADYSKYKVTTRIVLYKVPARTVLQAVTVARSPGCHQWQDTERMQAFQDWRNTPGRVARLARHATRVRHLFTAAERTSNVCQAPSILAASARRRFRARPPSRT